MAQQTQNCNNHLIHQRQQQNNQINHYYSTSSPAAAASTAQLVKQLRSATGAPMMECKKALSSPEVNNDIQLAQEWLRKHGSAKASSKVAGREALEGLVGMQISSDNSGASLVKVASETDFASRSEVFSNFVQEVANAAAAEVATTNHPKDKEYDSDDIATFMKSATNSNGKPLTESLNDAILAIRENLQVDSISLLPSSSPTSILAGYVHGRASPNSSCGSAASLVELEWTIDNDNTATKEEAQMAAKKLAMHIVAAKPQYLNPTSVPDSISQKEKTLLMEKLDDKMKNKPPEILDKIINGQMRKFYEGICLTEQAHMIEEGNPKVGKVVESLGLVVKDFRLMGLNK